MDAGSVGERHADAPRTSPRDRTHCDKERARSSAEVRARRFEMRSRTALRLGASLFGLLAITLGCSDGATRTGVIRQEIDADAALVIRQVYGGGSNSGAPLSHDFIELFNRSGAPVSLAGLSLQYASASGTGN